MNRVRAVFFSAVHYDSKTLEFPVIELLDGSQQIHLANWIDEEGEGAPDDSFSQIGIISGDERCAFLPLGRGNVVQEPV